MDRIDPTFDPARPQANPARPEIQPTQPQPSAETFCTYLAKQFIAKKGFEVARIPEAKRLYEICEIVLTRSDGYTFGVLCMVDREARPNATFTMSVEELEAIGKACLKYAGTINGRKMPVSVVVLEVGPASADQSQRLQAFKRSSLFAKVLPSAMAVDTTSGQVVWSNGGGLFSKGLYRGFVEKLLAGPREADADLAPPTVVVAAPSFPWLTGSILLMLSAVFAVEIVFGIGPWTGLLEPTVATLVAFGALMPNLVLHYGEWYRLLSAPFLHADAGHIVMNGIALYLAGRTLEGLIGRAWFGTVYVVGALTGSLFSLALNSDQLVSVGASGAIMGLFAAMLVLSMHFPPGPIRTGLQMNAIYVLLPSLLPLAGVLKGQQVDYAAHFGGAIGGAAVGFVLLRIWSKDQALPGFRQVAAAVAMAGVVALAYPAAFVVQGYQAVAFTAGQLIPSSKLPRSNTEMKVRAAQLIAEYPRDPRPRLLRAADLLDAGDVAGAEREARAGLADEELWRSTLSPDIDNGLRVILAIAINETHPDEALATARPVCAVNKDGPMHKMLDEKKLCSP
jgi:rhomboid protease GluP